MVDYEFLMELDWLNNSYCHHKATHPKCIQMVRAAVAGRRAGTKRRYFGKACIVADLVECSHWWSSMILG